MTSNFEFYVISADDKKHFLHIEPTDYRGGCVEVLYLSPLWADNFPSMALAQEAIKKYKLDTSKYKILKCKVSYSLEG